MKSLLVVFLLAAGCGAAEGLTREYIFVQSVASWYHARSHCRENYRDLATVTSTEDSERLLQSGILNYDSWIGLYMTYYGNWSWSDGETSVFRKWNKGSPYFQYNELCGYTHLNGFWLEGFCWNGKSFYCYRFLILVKENKTWNEAQEFCRTHYTSLVSVTSELSLKQLKLETTGTETESVWTGLHFIDGLWFSGSQEQPGIPLESLVSMPSCPHLFYRCGALNTVTDTLNNHHCNKKMNFVCYWE